MLTMFVKRLTKTAMLPVKATPGAACWDLFADSCEEDSGAFGWTVHTGLCVAIPEGFGMFIYPRSGLATKLGLSLRNGTGVIDSDYRGEIILKFNSGVFTHRHAIREALVPGSRVAQATILALPEIAIFETTEELSDTLRGTGGFGSTG